MNALGALLWKDVLQEIRGVERIPLLGLFSAAVLLTLHFSVAADSQARTLVAAGFLWATVVFAALLELRRSLESERQAGTLDGLLASPLDPTVLYLGKLFSSFAVLAVLEAVLVPLAVLFFSARADGILPALGVALAGTLGLLAWGTLFAAAAGGSRAGEVVLPILLFPLVVPVTIATVRLLSASLGGAEVDNHITGYLLIGVFDVLSVGTGILFFDYVLEA